MTLRLLPCLCALLFSVLALPACKDRFFNNPFDPQHETTAYDIVATLNVAGISPVDLAFSGDALWIVDDRSRLLAVQYSSGSLIRELSVGQQVSAICYDGSDLWLSIRHMPRLIKVNIINGEITKTLDLPRGDFSAIDYYQNTFWLADTLSNSIMVADSATGSILQTLTNPGFSLDGLAFDGTLVWLIDATQRRLYSMKSDGTGVTYYQTPGTLPAGLACSGGQLWVGDRSQQIFQLRFK
jgi:hypothetical protein